MIIPFFLTPKQEVIILSPKNTMRQALEKMEHHRYSAIPLIDEKGKYVGTITEGDLLWKIKNTPGLSFENTNKILLTEVPWHIKNRPVKITARVDSLLMLAISQNFVPVVDDNDVFIGIVKRSDIIEYCADLLEKKEGKVG
ncbi:MAG: inosine-5-monophosphate dehydrogenase [Desulfitibacter sp. BRH_c19]|nr:MAG: inosine-5-monophosphate dehydrogenase [Desulfitibacter sp. BRH_c19]